VRSWLRGCCTVGRYLAGDAGDRRRDGENRLSLLLPVLVYERCQVHGLRVDLTSRGG
jgi:hypothetical protein